MQSVFVFFGFIGFVLMLLGIIGWTVFGLPAFPVGLIVFFGSAVIGYLVEKKTYGI